ncbi:aminopeptidase P family protein [Mycoplasma sp. Mirounga ES2805-ORL]|uniref:aminopeptidase P family protein n=1 Tax=Mycoplasma sp. Mirounga ES2805-ORL TaxID=754514 RepID=UPI00197B59BD|nr:aminopeptidase P family protein [Mycoplasma sp. Mirounga ES2805-ORL]QSF13471.1 aminopeptidase P family protein [Mycoplasma sp. Mirounga ES2805-ORL]
MKIEELNKLFNEQKIDAYVSNAPQTRLWVTGVQTTDGFVVIEKDKVYLFVDSRYIEYCQKNAKNVDEIVLLQGTAMKDFFDKKKYQTVAFEEDYLIHEQAVRLENMINPKKIVWTSGQLMRIAKSDAEIEIMQKAIDISLKSYNELIKWIKEGMTEKEVAARLNYLMKLNGADKESFDEIVAFGPSSAEPHHHPTDRKLKEGDIVKIDFGALYKGYSADITRTTFFNPNNKPLDKKLEDLHKVVLEAAKAGRDAVKPGIEVGLIDKICRDYITEKGYGDFFLHSTGHGLGIDVHELPYVRTNAKEILKPGNIITVEPGIYIAGLGGSRNEDDVLVTETGRYVFSRPEERS